MALSDKVQIIHSIVQKDGKYIVLPVWVSGDTQYGNLAHPNPHANSSVGDTAQLYPHGTKFVDGERTFMYGYMHTADTSGKSNIGVYNINESATGTTASATWGATAGVAGDTTVYISTANFVDTTPAVDDFAGGWLQTCTNPYGSYRILGNSLASATTADEIDFYLDYGLAEAVTAAVAYVQIDYSQYTKFGRGWLGEYGAFCTVPGVTLIDSISSTWQWVQSWGPCYMSLDEAIGDADHRQSCIFGTGGSISIHTTNEIRQYAGFLMPSAGVATTMNNLIFLQINP